MSEVDYELFDVTESWDELLEPERLESIFEGKNVLGLIHTPERHANKRIQLLFYYKEILSHPTKVYVMTNAEPYDPSSHKKVMGGMVPYFSSNVAPH
jgi:hypothetical protein